MTSLVLINSPIQRYSETYRPEYKTTAPLGLGYLGTITRNAGIETVIVDAEAKRLSVKEIAHKVNSLSPKSVGINMFSTNPQISLEVLDSIDAPHKIIGGAHASLCGEDIARQRSGLLIVKGEAENAIVEAVKSQKTGLLDAGLVNDLDKLPFIDRSLYVNDPSLEVTRYESSMVTTRGCPYLCNFCMAPIMNGKRVRSRSIDNVLAEVRELKSRGVESIHFAEDIFNYSRERTIRLSKALKEIGVDWRALARIELLDDPLLETMRESGCYRLGFGVESGVPRILRQIGKNADLEMVRGVFTKCRQLGIETRAFFTIGHPTETEEEIRKTVDFAEELRPKDAYFMVVRAFPKTKLYAQMKAQGFTDDELNVYQQSQDDAPYVKYHVMNSRSLNGMTNEKLDNLIKGAYSRFYKRPELVGV